MKIAVASGKGGTGKTTVALALAEASLVETLLIDCDVEEPNCHLFLDSEVKANEVINVFIPEFKEDLCNGCGACVKACRFHALARLGKRVLVFPELCHSCGGCVLACQQNALSEKAHNIGVFEFRDYKNFKLASGVMNVGHSMSPPIIRQIKKFANDEKLVILDSPPGTACPFVTTVQECDYVVLVTEPTPFGLHDLKLAVAALKKMNMTYGVILNRATGKDDAIIEKYCNDEQIPLLIKIPFSYQAAQGYSQGKSLLQSMPELRGDFEKILQLIGAGK